MKIALTYDDIQMIPSFSKIKSRKDIDLKTLLSRRYGLLIPLIASPMDTVCEEEMAFKMFILGGCGCIHRFMSIKNQCEMINNLYNRIYEKFYLLWNVNDNWHSEIKDIPIVAAIGVKEEDRERAKSLVKNGANVLIIDVAHGHHINVINMIKWCKENLPNHVDIIAGNIATEEAAVDLEKAGADGLRVGIGGGCFPSDMEVKTTNGNKKISDIVIGDIVYTHMGEKHEVLNTTKYHSSEEIMIINDIECTKNHEFYVINKNDLEKIKCDDDINKYALWIPASDLNDNFLMVEVCYT